MDYSSLKYIFIVFYKERQENNHRQWSQSKRDHMLGWTVGSQASVKSAVSGAFGQTVARDCGNEREVVKLTENRNW